MTEAPNAEQERYWNEEAGPKWVRLGDRLDALVAPLGEAGMERAALAPGQRVIDVGCGCGATSLELARRVTPGGSVLAVDLSEPMLASARARMAAQAATGARFLRADAQIHGFEPAAADRVFSRLGVMFFSDPSAAFANLHTALRADGRLVFVCWRELAANPWMSVPLDAVKPHVPSAEPPSAGAAGPFAFADPDHVRTILETAGFARVEFERLDVDLQLGGGDLDTAVDFVLEMGPAGAALRQAPEVDRPAVVASLRTALAAYLGDAGVRMGGAAWIVSAEP